MNEYQNNGEVMKVTRGDILRVDLGEGINPDFIVVRGERPALVIQNNVANKHSSATIIAPITTTHKRIPTFIKIMPEESGLERVSYVNCASLLTIDNRQILKKTGKLSAKVMERVAKGLRVSIGL